MLLIRAVFWYGGSIRELKRKFIRVDFYFTKNYYIKNSKVINLKKEDIAIFFTDGVIEARSPNDNEFGIKKALRSIESQQQKSSKFIIENLYTEIRNFSNNMPQEDDITTIICQIAQN